METDLASRFEALWKRCAGNDSEAPAVWTSLRQHYAEGHRHYHTLAHIGHCLMELDAAGSRIEERDAVELALWFHDVIYLPDRDDNEAASADFFRCAAGPRMAEALVDEVCEMILATLHVEQAYSGATAYMVDIDLSSFGLPWEAYLRDSDALRREQRGIPGVDFYQSKLRFLDSLSARPAIFQTEFYRQRHEQSARDNIARYSAMIREWAVAGGEGEPGQ